MASRILHTALFPATGRRWFPGFGRSTDRRSTSESAPSRRSILALFAKGMGVMPIPFAIAATPSPALAQTIAAPTLLATLPLKPIPDWQAAQKEAMMLAAELRQARAELTHRIGPRGLTVGTLAIPGGGTMPIHLSDPETARRFWRRLPRELTGDRQAREATVAAVKAACDRWDALAQRAGLGDLERRAASARDRAKVWTARAAAAPAVAL